ncbi:MAG: WG repeat-containing protein [Phycisphaeraceae bacterium]
MRLAHKTLWHLAIVVVVGFCAPGSGVFGQAVGGWTPEWVLNANDRSLSYRGVRGDETLYSITLHGLAGHVTASGDLAIAPVYDWADSFYDNLARVGLNGRVGFVNRRGHLQIKPVFERADRFMDGLARVRVEGRWGFVDKNGRWAIRPEFEAVGRFHGGLAAVLVEGRVGYIDKSGRVVVSPRYSRGRGLIDGQASVELVSEDGEQKRWAVMDRSGRLRWTDPTGEVLELGDLGDNLLRARTAAGWGYLDRSFRWVITPGFDEARDFSMNLAAVKREDGWGYIGKDGAWRLEPAYELADDFEPETGVAMVRERGGVGFIDRQARWVVEPVLAEAEPFAGNFARVRLPAGWTWMDRQGRSFWNPARQVDQLVDRSATLDRILRDDPNMVFRVKRVYPASELRSAEPTERPFVAEYLYETVLPESEKGLTVEGGEPEVRDSEGERLGSDER